MKSSLALLLVLSLGCLWPQDSPKTLGVLGKPPKFLSVEHFPSKLRIPERFEDYQKRGTELPSIVSFANKRPVLFEYYDIDDDGKPDVCEGYFITGYYGGNRYQIMDNPFFYGFDFNQDGELGRDEIFVDPSMDGLNGNEIRAGSRTKDNATSV